MHVAAGADALDDLLAEVAAFGEVQGAGLAGLLREFAVADVGAVEGSSFENAQPFEALWFAKMRAGVLEGFGELCQCVRGIGPELESRHERAVGMNDGDVDAVPGDVLHGEWFEILDVRGRFAAR